MKTIILNFAFFLSFFNTAFAQINYSNAFAQKLEEGQLIFVSPVEGKYKDILIEKNDFFNCDLAIKSRKENLEIRYAIQPLRIDNPIHQVPQVAAMQAISNAATNSQETVIAVHNIPQTVLEKQFNAEWGTVAYFTPKAQFSNKKHCKMILLHSEGKANVFIFFLFDKASEELDMQMGNLRFMESEEY